VELFGTGGYRVKRNNDYQEKMRILREKSRREQEVREILKSGIDSRKERKTYLSGIPVFFAPSVVSEEPDPTEPHLFGEPSIPALPLDNIEEDIPSPQESVTPGEDKASSKTRNRQ